MRQAGRSQPMQSSARVRRAGRPRRVEWHSRRRGLAVVWVTALGVGEVLRGLEGERHTENPVGRVVTIHGVAVIFLDSTRRPGFSINHIFASLAEESMGAH